MKRIFLTLTLVLFVIPLGISQDLPSYVPTDGLVAYYPFNGNANDASGNGNHGTVNGATLATDGDGNENSAYSFDGEKYEGNSINIGSSIFNDPNSFSIYVTVNVGELYVHENPFSYIFSQASGGEIQISHHSDYLGFASKLNNDSWLICEITPEVNKWVNYVYTYSEELNRIIVYTNGVETCTKEINSTLFSYEGPAMIGRQSNVEHNYFNGIISEIGFWNRALSEQEIQNLYNSSTGDILLNGTVSVENNQIKNVADPTDAQDAATKSYVDLLFIKINELQDQIDALQSNSGSETVTDQNGNSYPYLTYGDKVWTVKNAEVVTYRDGTEIPQVTDATEWSNLTTGAWCYYDNDPTKHRLYNWYAVMGIHDADPNTPNKEFAPEGWHVPTDAEWTTLEGYLIANGYNYDQSTTANKIAKAMASTTGWNSSANTGTIGNDQSLNNDSEFNAIPDGYRIGDGSFNYEGLIAVFWSSTESHSNNAWGRILYYNYSYLNRSDFNLQNGFSVRFVRD